MARLRPHHPRRPRRLHRARRRPRLLPQPPRRLADLERVAFRRRPVRRRRLRRQGRRRQGVDRRQDLLPRPQFGQGRGDMARPVVTGTPSGVGRLRRPLPAAAAKRQRLPDRRGPPVLIDADRGPARRAARQPPLSRRRPLVAKSDGRHGLPATLPEAGTSGRARGQEPARPRGADRPRPAALQQRRSRPRGPGLARRPRRQPAGRPGRQDARTPPGRPEADASGGFHRQ